jgi:peptidoglycan/xylan/chitin deacetylase (PgdA/CDA1 family)
MRSTVDADGREVGQSQTTVPILCYHAVAASASGPDGRFAIAPELLRQHLDLLVERGYSGISVRDLALARTGLGSLPERPVAVTFDDGFADVLHAASPLLLERGFTATAFVTTDGISDRAGKDANRKLTWQEVVELDRCGIEVAAHGHRHLEMDCAPWSAVEQELVLPKELLGDRLGHSIATFAYPYGYSTPQVRERLAEAGYLGACGVKHALSTANDDLLDMARLRLLGTTSAAKLGRWLDGDGVRLAPCGERTITRAWRVRRRLRYAVSGRRQKQ